MNNIKRAQSAAFAASVFGSLPPVNCDRATSELNRLAASIAGENASPLATRSARVLANVWLSGKLMVELELIPSVDVETIVRWAWERRASETVQEPFERALETLRHALVTRRNLDVLPLKDQDDRFRGRPVVAYYEEQGDYEVYYVPSKDLSTLFGGNLSSRHFLAELHRRGVLDRPKREGQMVWDKLPDGTRLSHCRFRDRRLSAEG